MRGGGGGGGAPNDLCDRSQLEKYESRLRPAVCGALIGGGVGHDVDDRDYGGDDVGDDDGDSDDVPDYVGHDDGESSQAIWTVWRLNVGVVLAR